MKRAARKWLTKKVQGLAGAVALQSYWSLADAGERRVDSFGIVGEKRFVDEVIEALNRLYVQYPFGYRLAQRYIKAIVATPKPINFGFLAAVCFEVPTRVGSLPWSTDRFAAVIVRDAVLSRLSGHRLWMLGNRRVQLVASRAELRCMEELGCHAEYMSQQRNYMTSRAREGGQS